MIMNGILAKKKRMYDNEQNSCKKKISIYDDQ